MIVCRHIPPAPGCHRLPFTSRSPGQFLPGLPAVGRTEQGGIFDAGIDRVGIGQRRFEMPDPLEFPGTLRAVIMLVRRERLPGLWGSVVDKLVAFTLRHAIRSRVGSPGGVPG